MSATPKDFQIPNFGDDDTKRYVRAGELKDLAKATAYLVGSERERRGEVKAIKTMVAIVLVIIPLALTGAGAFITWAAKTLIDVQSDIRVLSTEFALRGERRE